VASENELISDGMPKVVWKDLCGQILPDLRGDLQNEQNANKKYL
jgi:hypothetical protein